MTLALAGCRVVVTRSESDAQWLSEQLRNVGAEPVNVPLIKIEFSTSEKLTKALASLADGSCKWAVVTSVNGARVVAAWFQRANVLQQYKLAAVGRQSASALEEAGLRVDVRPAVQTAADLVTAFPDAGKPGESVAAFLGDLASETVVDGLTSKGYNVTRVEVYCAKSPTYSAGQVTFLKNELAASDAILFTSPSTVQRFVALFGADLAPQLAICIGPSTAAAAAKAGIAHIVAQYHSQEGVLDALCEAWK